MPFFCDLFCFYKTGVMIRLTLSLTFRELTVCGVRNGHGPFSEVHCPSSYLRPLWISRREPLDRRRDGLWLEFLLFGGYSPPIHRRFINR